MALRQGAPAPWAYWRWHLARETGWTLAEIDGLTLGDLEEYFQVTDGESKARGAAAEAAKFQQQAARRRRR